MGGWRLYRAASPINSDDLPTFDSVQTFDVLYMAQLGYDPLKMLRLDHTDWQFETVAFAPTAEAPTGLGAVVDDPNQDTANNATDAWAFFPQEDQYLVTGISANGQESRASAPVSATNDLTLKRNKNTVSWTANGSERYRVYKSHNGSDFGLMIEVTGTEVIDDNLEIDYTVGPPVGRDPFSADGDKPSTVALFEQRLWWGRTLNNPNALYSARSADLENMDVSRPVREDDAITIRLVAQGVNQAYQIVPMEKLRVFSSDGIWEIEGANSDYLTAAPPPRIRRATARGCSRLEPLVIDSKALYKTKNGQQIRMAGYSFELDGIKSDEVSIFSPDFFEGFDITSWCFAEDPLSVVWAARSDGNLLAFTWQEEHSVWGWTECPLPNGGKVRSLTTVRENGEDRPYAILSFTIAGVERFVRCRMASARWWGLDYACHLDCSVTREYDTPSAVVGGLWHLEGETVAAFADGRLFENLVVENGEVTLPAEVSRVHVGLPYDAIAKTLPLDIQAAGKAQGRKQQTGTAVIRLTRSLAPEVGLKETKMRPLKVRYEDLPLLSGLFEIETDPAVRYESDVTIRIRSAPLTVLATFIDADASG